jgi:hypothetical protein
LERRTGVIALLSCDAARLAARRAKGLTGVAAAFVAAFVVYKGLIFGFGVAMARALATSIRCLRRYRESSS